MEPPTSAVAVHRHRAASWPPILTLINVFEVLESAMITSPAAIRPVFELRFQSLFAPGRALAFPCDAQGHVDLNTLSERARNNYLFARATVGRDHATPRVSVAD